MKKEAKIRLMLSQANGLWKPPEAGRREGSAVRVPGASANTLISDF